MLWIKSVSNKNYSSVLFVINSKLDNESYCTNFSYHNKRVMYMGIYLTKSDFKESNNREIRSAGESMFIKV